MGSFLSDVNTFCDHYRLVSGEDYCSFILESGFKKVMEGKVYCYLRCMENNPPTRFERQIGHNYRPRREQSC
jgi:hypothetical protein